MPEPITDLSEQEKSLKKEKNNGELSETNITSIVEASVDVEIVTTEEGFDNLKKDWKELLNQPLVNAHIFQTFAWQRLWWKYFGGNNRLHVITVWNDDKLIGLAPLFVDRTSLLGLFEYKTLKFIGTSIPNIEAVGGFTSYSISDYLDIVVDPDNKCVVVEAFINYLKKSRHLVDQIELNEMSETSTFVNQILPKIWQREWEFSGKPTEVCPKIELPDDISKYLDDLHRKARYKLRYSKRAVTEKDLFKVYEVNNEKELDSAFEKFVTLHQKRWNKRGYPGIFANKQFESFLKDISRAFIQNDRLKMSTAVDNDDQCIAVDFAFHFNGRVYDYQKAFDAESELAKYSPGKALTYFLIEDAIADENECVDLLRGGEKYKLRFSNQKTQNWTLTIPGLGRKDNLKENLYSIVQTYRSFKESLQREQLLLKVHLNQWGLSGFLSEYAGFLKYRIKERF